MEVYREVTRVTVDGKPASGIVVETVVVRYKPEAGVLYPPAYLVRVAVTPDDAPRYVEEALYAAHDIEPWVETLRFVDLPTAVRQAIKWHDETLRKVEAVIQAAQQRRQAEAVPHGG